eukprot:CAMPEP_0198296986 /NCGR_PEP_ID=MMETSP1449-20131203/34839_1 /TAXON_ID=420275 /ORGANISM="Attheya septentrionalis, Strain CCMP2084" /LENGTH=284 /DNA_ID=CAMNT_0043997763 /DNA_START=155 /DNA_END=1009 /DNA_ORIENTATION=+
MTDQDNEYDYCEILRDMERIAKEAGMMALEAQKVPIESIAKPTAALSTDVVTETDRKVEEYIIKELLSKYPFEILGEETFDESKGYQLSAKPTFVIDPIDGTVNYINRTPYYCVCIGLAVKRQAVLGVIYNPTTQEIFSGSTVTKTSTLNGVALSADCDETNHNNMIFVTEFGSDRTPAKTQVNLDMAKALLELHPRAIRMGGSAALNCMTVARGSCHAYVEYGPHPWDVCAAIPIVTQAGGHVIPADPDVDAQTDLLTCRGYIIATTPTLCQTLQSSIPQFKY